MDALQIINTNVPDWIKRLDELSGQIDQRQIELARLVEHESSSSSSPTRTKSLRNKGSTESLKPHDDIAAHGDEQPSAAPGVAATPAAKAAAEPAPAPSPPSPQANLISAKALQHQANQVMEVAHAKARATLRKRTKRSDSMVSAEGTTVKYRTRSMIIVYYDSYVQSFFEELVKFVSASRNMMRKAKMAAKVAQIKRMAELEMPDADESMPPIPTVAHGSGSLEVDPNAPIIAAIPAAAPAAKPDADKKLGDGIVIEAADTPAKVDELPKLNYVSSRQMRSGMLARPGHMRASARMAYARAGGRSYGGSDNSPFPPDVYSELDKGLEYVQSMCEHAAHQFLRDGDCNDEIDNVKRRLAEVKEQAAGEIERIKKEDPEALKAAEESPKTRSFRPQSMRKDFSSSGSAAVKDSAEPAASAAAVAAAAAGTKPATPVAAGGDMVIEVDEGIDDMEEDTPKLK